MAITPQYQSYLNSPKWKATRLKVLRRDKFICQRCKKARATQVHHKTYKRIFKERMGDLISICATCHRNIHGITNKPKRKKSLTFGKVLAKMIR